MPRYTHDCEHCVSLGEFGEFDLYFCDHGGFRPTVISRWGNDGSEYSSGLEIAHLDNPLGEAKRRAINNGLLSV